MPGPEEIYDLDLGPDLPDNVYEIAVKQGENSDLKCALIQELRDMIFEKGECTPHRTDDDFLIKFLRCRFWKVQNAYKLLCRYCDFREANRNLFEKVHPLDLKAMGDADILNVAPYRDQVGRRIMIHKFGNWNTSMFSTNDIFTATLLLLELGSLEPIAQVLGGVGIFDLKGLSLSHVLQLTPSVAQKMISLMVTSMPIRTTAIHVVNQNWVFNAAFQIFKPFLSARMRERIFIHGDDWESLHKHIYPNYLPKRYGGTNLDFPYFKWIEGLSKNEMVRKELEQLGYVVEARENNA